MICASVPRSRDVIGWAILLGACLWPTVAAADQWNKIQSRNFLIVGDVGHARLSYIARTLEQFRLASSRTAPDRPLTAKQPLTIVVLGGTGIFDYGPGRSGNVAGYYQPTDNHDYIVMASTHFGGYDFRTILHEYQHLIVRATGVTLPGWANEGLADFYSTFRESKGGKRYEIGRLVQEHLATLENNGIVPLEKFFTEDGRSLRMEEVFRVGNYYAQSWALIHFFQFGNDGKWSDKLPPFLEALASGEAPRAAFERTVGVSLDTFESALKIYLTQPRFNFAWFESQDVGDRELGSQRGKLSVAETETLKATLMNDPVKAGRALDTALTADPNYRPARVQRARRLVSARETARAVEDLIALTDQDPTDLETCGLAMFALNSQRRFEQTLKTCAGATSAVIVFERIVSLEGAERMREVGPLFAALAKATADELGALGWRSWRYLEEGQYTAASRAADLLSSRSSGTPDGLSYQRFVRTASLCQIKLCAEARADLRRVSIPQTASMWVQSVYRFLIGDIDADALMRDALSSEQQTEAHTYIALDLIAGAQSDAAQRHLKWVAEQGSSKVTEYFVALAHMKRLVTR